MMLSLFRRHNKAASTKRRRDRTRRLQFEAMEGRTLMSATVIGTIDFGTSRRTGGLMPTPSPTRFMCPLQTIGPSKSSTAPQTPLSAQIPTRGYDAPTVNPQSNEVYVSQQFAGSVRIIDGSTNSVIGELSVPGPYGSLGRPAVNPTTDRLYVIGLPKTLDVFQASTRSFLGGSTPRCLLHPTMGLGTSLSIPRRIAFT